MSLKLFLSLFIALPTFANTPTPTVFAKKVNPTPLFDVLTYPARVTSKVNGTLFSDIDGIVKTIPSPLGTRVKAGQRVMVLEHVDPVYQYAPVTIAAPVAGVVSSIKATVGSRVTRGQALASVTDPKQVRIEIEATSQDLPVLKNGTRGELTLSGHDQPLPVIVRGISPIADEITGTATAELEPVNAKAPLYPGVVGQVSFKVRERKGIVIPEHALVYKGSDSFVRIIEDNKAKRVAVRLGSKQRGQVEILSGLKDGDQLVERTSGFVADGEAVKVETSDEKSQEKTEK